MEKYTDCTTKKAQVEFIRNKLSNSEQWAIRGLLKIYEYQTTDEQESGYTSHDNGVGFTGVDSEILTSFAQWYKSKGFLSPKQKDILFKKMPKYAKQLNNIAQG